MGLSQSLNNYSNRMGQSNTTTVLVDKKTASGGLLLSSNHKRLPSIRTKQPMPESHELEQRFTKILASMDLPPDKAKLLKNYDREKKWDIICDQEMVHAKDPPSYYLNKLRTYLDPKASRSHRKRKMVLDSTSTQVLRDLEISLRTNNIEWVREFLSDENRGLDVLVDYLNFRLMMMRQEHRIRTANSEESILSYNHNSTNKHNNNSNNLVQNSHKLQYQSQQQQQQQQHDSQQQHKSYQESHNQQESSSYVPVNGSSTINKAQINDFSTNSDSPTVRRRSKHVAKLNMGEAQDDIHLCILCLRAIMNNKYGYNRVISHQEAINYIALSLIHKSLRTKALVLELLAAVCLVKGGHAIIIAAFDNFKEVFHERHRFQTLMDYFMNYEVFHIEFMVACMQFVNIVVHSVNDLNFRVHLQYEFTILGLDDYLKKLRITESEQLQTQISAFYDNVFDVSALMDDSETKTAALEKVAELEEELGQAHERICEIEREALAKLANLETELSMIKQERDELLESRRQTDELMSTLKRAELESKKRQSILESKILELETMTKSLPNGTSNISLLNSHNSSTKSVINGILPEESNKNERSLATNASVAMPPPPPPPLPFKDTQKSTTMSITAPTTAMKHANSFIPSVPTPPPPAGFMQAPDGSMTIKRKVQTKYKLPTLNWIAMKPNQVRGTIFNELDDDKLHNTIDFNDFEERFKIGINGVVCNEDVDGLSTFPSKRFKKPENVTLLEHTRLRNIAISRRKLDMPVDKVIVAINSLDLKLLSLENVELLQRMVPTDQEVKAYREYVCEKKNINLLTEEDKFLLQLTRVERISTKLAVMNYIGNFFENLHLISPQVHAIISAASSVKNSKKLRSILEIILAFGNYMNSSKRGPAYGFKLQSLDTLMDTKSSDKRMCLMHYIAATIRQKFPELLNFDSELLYIDKAALVSMENLVADIQELEKGMDQVRKEFDLRSKSGQHFILRDFLANSEDKFRRLKIDIRSAQDSFRECVEYFGESPRSTDANTFFALLVRFARSFKLADTENEQRRRLELAATKNQNKEDEDTIRMNKLNQKKQQEAVINELKHRTKSVQEKKLLHQDEVYNGALEDILLGLKSEPYRRADAVRRSQRRKIDNNRLSKSIDEYDL